MNRLSLVRGLHEAGAGLLLGTDTGNPFVLPGFAVHRELALLVEAGLDPYAAIAAGSASVGRFLGREVGRVEIGCRADLLLVDDNPLRDPSTLSRPRGVAIGGRWCDAEALAELRSGIEDR